MLAALTVVFFAAGRLGPVGGLGKLDRLGPVGGLGTPDVIAPPGLEAEDTTFFAVGYADLAAAGPFDNGLAPTGALMFGRPGLVPAFAPPGRPGFEAADTAVFFTPLTADAGAGNAF